jgi:hypothetical protein
MHLPATVAVYPDSGYVCFAGHRVSAAGGLFCGVIYESGDIGAEEPNVWIKKLDGPERALLMESRDVEFECRTQLALV